MKRSDRADVRNPVLALEAGRALSELDPAARQALSRVLRAISADARSRADKCWKTHKAPMAVYWKGVAVYAGHLARALDKGGRG